MIPTRKLLQQALDLLESYRDAPEYADLPPPPTEQAIRNYLAKPEPEPVAWKDTNYGNLHHQSWDVLNDIPLYTKDQL